MNLHNAPLSAMLLFCETHHFFWHDNPQLGFVVCSLKARACVAALKSGDGIHICFALRVSSETHHRFLLHTIANLLHHIELSIKEIYAVDKWLPKASETRRSPRRFGTDAFDTPSTLHGHRRHHSTARPPQHGPGSLPWAGEGPLSLCTPPRAMFLNVFAARAAKHIANARLPVFHETKYFCFFEVCCSLGERHIIKYTCAKQLAWLIDAMVFVPDHAHWHSTALVVFSLYTRRDIDSDDSHARPLIHTCTQPTVWFERERKLRAGHRAETRQTW